MDRDHISSTTSRLVQTVESSSHLIEQVTLLNSNLLQLRERLRMLDASLQTLGRALTPKRLEVLTDPEIDALPTVSAVNEDCAICLESLDGPAVQLPCPHRFHRDCFANWGRLRSVCPICREEVSKH